MMCSSNQLALERLEVLRSCPEKRWIWKLCCAGLLVLSDPDALAWQNSSPPLVTVERARHLHYSPSNDLHQ